ncbi:hypothetical protein BY996DRAFT_6413603 [Phakopsora pachyrhizi]|nr:hypothetical protein BY996DRAFT_6413603 [Phakopsora pachyrhizi]
MRSIFSRKGSSSSNYNQTQSNPLFTHTNKLRHEQSYSKISSAPSHIAASAYSQLQNHSGPLHKLTGGVPSVAVDQEDDFKCPVCLEDLRMKLKSEKGAVIPDCGHQLHESCFEAVYGSVVEARITGNVLGLCGVCRKDMQLTGNTGAHKGDQASLSHLRGPRMGASSSTSSKNKFAMVAGLVPSSNPGSQFKMKSITNNHSRNPLARFQTEDANYERYEEVCKEKLVDESDSDEFGFEISSRPNFGSAPSSRSRSRSRSRVGSRRKEDLNTALQDDELLPHCDLHHLPSAGFSPLPNQSRSVTKPFIRAICDTSTLIFNKHSRQTQNLTCMVSVELPTQYPFRPRSISLPVFGSTTSPIPPPINTLPVSNSSNSQTITSTPTTIATPTTTVGILSPFKSDASSPATAPSSTRSHRSNSYSSSVSAYNQLGPPPLIHSINPSLRSMQIPSSAASPKTFQFSNPDPFFASRDAQLNSDLLSLVSKAPTLQLPTSPADIEEVFQDLMDRIRDWKGHSPHDFGRLIYQGRVQVEKDSNRRDFVVCLFEEALLCISEDPNKMGPKEKPKLKLKGRVYIRHISTVTAQDDGERGLSLRVKMEDENLDEFVMRFDNTTELESWGLMIQRLLEMRKGNQTIRQDSQPKLPGASPPLGYLHQCHYKPTSRPATATPVVAPAVNPSVQRDMNNAFPSSGPTTAPFPDSNCFQHDPASGNRTSGSDSGYASSAYTSSSKTTYFASGTTLSSVGEEGNCYSYHASWAVRKGSNSSPPSQPTEVQIKESTASIKFLPYMNPNLVKSALARNPPTLSSPSYNGGFSSSIPVDPVDLCMILSIPIADNMNFVPNSNQLKLKLLQQSLQFLIHHLHPRSRLSLIIYTVGSESQSGSSIGFQLKSTPFLSIGDPKSFKRLEFVIQQIARSGDPSEILNSSNVDQYTSPFWDSENLDRSNSTSRSSPNSSNNNKKHDFARGFNKENDSEGIRGNAYSKGLDDSDTAHSGFGSDLDLRIRKWTKRLMMIERNEEKVSVVTAVNLALDIVLQRKQKNLLSGILVLHDGGDTSSRVEMQLVMARAEVADIPIHTIGWGKQHHPKTLWQLSTHSGGSYTFVKDWYTIKDALSGVVGGILSVGINKIRVRVSVPEMKWFKIKKVSGAPGFVLSSDGKYAEVELNELRFGERRDLLIEMEVKSAAQATKNQVYGHHAAQPNAILSRYPKATPPLRNEFGQENPIIRTGSDQSLFSVVEKGIEDVVGLEDAHKNLMESGFEEMNDDVPLIEVDASYKDPRARKEVPRLPRPVCLRVAVVSANEGTVGLLGSEEMEHKVDLLSSTNRETKIARRRIELLTSDSLSRASLLVSRRLDRQAFRLLNETSLIILKLIKSYYGIDLSRLLLTEKSNVDQIQYTNSRFGDVEDEDTRFLAGVGYGKYSSYTIPPAKPNGMKIKGTIKRPVEELESLLVLSGCLEVIDTVTIGIEEIDRGLKEVDRLMSRAGGEQLGDFDRESSGSAAAREVKIHKVYQKFDIEMKSWIGEQSGILRDQRCSFISNPEPVVLRRGWTNRGENYSKNTTEVGDYTDEMEHKSTIRDGDNDLLVLWILALHQQRNTKSSTVTPTLSHSSSVSSIRQKIQQASGDSQCTMKTNRRLGSLRSNKLEKIYFSSDYGILLRNMIGSWVASD